MSIQFPILNISLSNLSSQDLEETHIGDLWDYPGDNSIFEEYYNNQKYVDQSGHIFKINTSLIFAPSFKQRPPIEPASLLR